MQSYRLAQAHAVVVQAVLVRIRSVRNLFQPGARRAFAVVEEFIDGLVVGADPVARDGAANHPATSSQGARCC